MCLYENRYQKKFPISHNLLLNNLEFYEKYSFDLDNILNWLSKETDCEYYYLISNNGKKLKYDLKNKMIVKKY